MAQLVKNLPAMWETWVQSLCWGDPLGEGNGQPTPVFWPGEFIWVTDNATVNIFVFFEAQRVLICRSTM